MQQKNGRHRTQMGEYNVEVMYKKKILVILEREPRFRRLPTMVFFARRTGRKRNEQKQRTERVVQW